VTRTPKPKPLEYGDGSVFQRKDTGRWIVKIRQDGRYVQIGSSMDEQVARQILVDYHADRAAGLALAGRDWLLADWLDYWLSTKQPRYDRKGNRIAGVEPTTYEKYEIELRRHVKPYIGKWLALRLVDVRKDQVVRWQIQLNDDGRLADVQREALARLQTALELAVDHDYILRNPARGVQKPRTLHRKHVQPSELDLRRLLRAIDGDALAALVWLGLGAGFRRAEIAGLQWSDVSIYADDAAEIRAHTRRNRLSRRTQRSLGLPYVLEREGLKAQDERVVPVAGLIVQVLRQRWAHQVAQYQTAGAAWKGPAYDPEHPSGYLFTSEVGTPLQVEKISAYMTAVRERAGLDIDRFHALRRAFTTLLSKAGVHNRVTQEMAGHADIGMTEYYQQPMQSQKRDAAQALDEVLRDIING